MPDVRNCRRCGHIFNYVGGAPICPVCKQADEDDFRRIKQYLYDNPGATLSEVSTVLDVSVEKIKMFLREGRLEIVNNEGNMVLECEKCGKSIRSGRLCNECQRGFTDDLKSAASDLNQSLSQASTNKAIGMRYLNKDEK